ncbi:MAG: FAD:protein FMN transferase [Candidatus Omnitrophica bacterium]|nr:FAD:protein FMN transferase [Candidatus Omnitrophota bacterium]
MPRLTVNFLSLSMVYGLWAIVSLSGCQSQRLYKDNRLMMGTYIEVTSPYSQAPGIVFEEIARIEGLLSRFDPASEISILNRTGSLKASLETFEIIKKAKEFYRSTDGAFDITVGPLMKIWGFTLHQGGAGFTDKQFRVPEQSQITSALEVVGSDKIILQEMDFVVKFEFPGMEVDLGGIAKGYSLDQAVRRLKENHIDSCLINAGGQVFCLGDKFGRPWQIGIRDPRRKGLSGDLELSDKSVATSGDYEQYYIADNQRYSHIIDPRRGYPASSGVVSVTVIAEEAMTADALATAIFVLGKKEGERLVGERFPSVEIKIIEEKDIAIRGYTR